MKNLVLLFATLMSSGAFAVEVGDVIHIPSSALTCTDRTVEQRCFCDPPGKIYVHYADLKLNHTMKQVTERLHIATRLDLGLQLGAVTSVTGGAYSN